MDYSDLLEVDLGTLQSAVTTWKQVVTDLAAFADEARDGMQAKSDRARWAGVNADVTREFVTKTAKEIADLHQEAKSIWSVLDDAHSELEALQRRAKALTHAAAKDGFVVTGGADGTVKVMEAQCTVEGSGQKTKDLLHWYADTLASVVSHAAEVDAALTRALRASHGGDPSNAGHATYTSLDEDMYPRAQKLAGLGDDANEGQRAELRRLWQSLSPEARARLWAEHRDDLLAAGLLDPQAKRAAADDGSGAFDVKDPGAEDYWIQAQAVAMANSGDFIGYTDAARHMDHYLNGTGETLDLDVDRMLSDDQALRLTSQQSLLDHQDEWRRQALEAYERSGGKPVAIPIETPGQGYTHSDRNWYLAIGRGMTNTTGMLTVVPGADGKPKVSLDYQVNVWDRYNWDPGKQTPIGGTEVTDADMARLHTTGLAKEFDMRGSGSVQHYDLGSGSGEIPDPVDPGRDGTRTDIGRNGDAR
ncbi:hypothetical protein [Streptomyces griseosporeus]|uniref:hypothetical protein n=1 Tax=Streptomyces griseosporeus TaxID=1910 RepID=UPI00167D0E54|nr:hypothetical protein [Streptomyces griseosporeus]GHF69050.1 hypothetical protein GCM10018783_43100 [Streptomyces griseosporeus]